MKSHQLFKSYRFVFKSSVLVLLICFVSNTAFAQFNLIGIKGPAGENTYVVLKTLHIPNDTKKTNYTLVFDDYKNTPFPSGTLLETPANTKLSLEYKGQIQVLQPNSMLEVKIVKKGVVAQLFSGELKNVFESVKERVGFYKVGNGYTWAFAEGTTFWVTANSNSKKANFRTEDDSEITILENQKAAVNGRSNYEIGKMGKSKQLYATTVRVLGSNGSYEAGNLGEREFSDAIDAREVYLKLLDDGYESSDLLINLAETYLAVDDFSNAKAFLARILDEYSEDLSDESYFETTLLYSQVSAELGMYAEAEDRVNSILPDLKANIGTAIDDCQDADDYEFLGWAYDLLGNITEADRNYAISDGFNCFD